MKQNSIKDLPKLRPDCYENIFNIYEDINGLYFYNILQTISLPDNLPKGYYKEYNVVYGDTWPLISYKNYDTPNLWWLILMANKINNPTVQPQAGQKIDILNNNVARSVLSQIKITE
jgi:nucleoid-associated protein YgaU